MYHAKPLSLTCTVALLWSACSSADRTTIQLADVLDFESASDAGEPNLYTTPGDEVLMSWLTHTEGGNALMVASRTSGTWDQPTVAYASDQMFANWADFPSVTATSDGTWVVHWLEKVATAPYAYHARVARSTDRGKTWSEPVTIHSDLSPTEHGFVTMVPASDGTVDMVWLDGRATGSEPRGPMQVRSGILNEWGGVSQDIVVDDRVCDCCQTALTRTDAGLVTAYRDRTEGEIRDIAVRVNTSGSWSDPVHVGNDRWHITGCPVNGPSLTAIQNTVGIVWFTAPEREGKVQVAFSPDNGTSFGDAIRVDDGAPLGRVDIEMLNETTALVIWMERIGEEAEIRGITVKTDGTKGDPATLVSTSQARQSGFPRLTRSGNDVLMAYRSLSDDGNTIKVVRATWAP